VKSASAKSGCATKTASVETASTKTTGVETASTKTAAVKAATTKTAAAVEAPATASATAGQGNSRCKHANRGSCNQGDDCSTQHECTP
jgi:RNA polymerase primary sigma factor